MAGVGLTAAWLLASGAAAESGSTITSIAAPMVDVVAALLVASAARSAASARIRLAWGLIAVAMAVYAAGDAIWAWIDLVEQHDPFPSAADLAYVGFYPIVVGALLLFPVPARAKGEAVRLSIDSAIVVLGGGMVVWHSLLLPTLSTSEPDPIRAGLSLGYPIGDLVLLFGVATSALRRPAGIAPPALMALVAGLTLMLVADVAYGELALSGRDPSGLADLLYLGASLAIACAGWLQRRATPVGPDDESVRLGRWQMALPYAGLAAGFGILIATSDRITSTSLQGLLLGAVVLTLLVLVRQEITNQENRRLVEDGVRREAEARYRSLEGLASDAVLLVDEDGVVTYASPSLQRVLGLDGGAIVGTKLSRVAHADDQLELERLIADTAAGRPTEPLEWSLWARDGVWRQVETVSTNLLEDASIGQIVLTTRDVRERQALRRQLTQAAFRDLLTDLPNRALFGDRVAHAVASGRRAGRPTAILKLDLDGFTRLNDSLGPAMGDQVLLEVARRLSRSMRTADTVARLGGDEFAVLLDGRATTDDALEAAERIRAALREPMTIGGRTIAVTTGIGIATTEEASDCDATVLTRNANVALSVARAEGHDRVVAFVASMQKTLEAQVELESDLRRAVAERQLVLHYQPIVDLATRRLVAAEALVRWDHPTRGRLAPDMFIPIAEETGLIGEIGTWVLQTACAEVARWAACAPATVPRVSVNLASAQVSDPNLPWTVRSALAQAGAATSWLTLELTERQLVQNTTDVLERLHAIRALGVQISIDDFGTGYSSLAYLQQFPVGHIKIDRSFVTPLEDPERGPGVAGAIVEIGRALGMSTIAEGIESERQRERLLALGCPLGQGYLFGRPLEPEAMLALVAAVPAFDDSPAVGPRSRAVGERLGERTGAIA
jgi:diguanylate cyclase (GGDEF)-like protein/PAS domain S-box-containing protein